MGYLRIKCGSCGGAWEVYPKLRKYDAARTCPHCDQRITDETWKKKILPAYNAMLDANTALTQDHVNYHNAAFEVSYIANGTYTNAQHGEAMNALEELRSDLLTALNSN